MDVMIVLIAFIAMTLISALILATISWSTGFSLWVIIVLVSLLAVVRWHSNASVYRCPECGHLFSIGMVTDLLSPHGIGGGSGWKLLTCPKCGSYVRANVLLKEEAELRGERR